MRHSTGEIVVVEPLGSRAIVIVRVGEHELTAEAEPEHWLQPRVSALLSVTKSHGHLFDGKGRSLLVV